jgi:hypothetical protein
LTSLAKKNHRRTDAADVGAGVLERLGGGARVIEKKNALEAVTGPYEKLVAHQEELALMAELLEDEGHVAEDHPDVSNWAGRWRCWRSSTSTSSCSP